MTPSLSPSLWAVTPGLFWMTSRASNARAVGLTATLVSVPLVLNAVGAEEFGLWTTVTSGVALLNLADLGIGNSLLNAIARTRARIAVRA